MTVKTWVIGVLLVLAALVGTAVLPQTASAAVDFLNSACSNADMATSQICPDKNNANTAPLVKTIVDMLLYVVMICSVIMIILGGARYAMSGGDSGKVTSAKNTILYAVVGIVVAVLAWAIVGYVANQLGVKTTKTAPAGGSPATSGVQKPI